MDSGKYNPHPGSEGAPTWTLVSTIHILETGSTYMDTGKYNAHLGAGSTYMDTGKYTAHPGSREHLHGHW